VETAADMAIARARTFKEGKMNLTWGAFVNEAVAGNLVSAAAIK
jgi:hypothetical protein